MNNEIREYKQEVRISYHLCPLCGMESKTTSRICNVCSSHQVILIPLASPSRPEKLLVWIADVVEAYNPAQPKPDTDMERVKEICPCGFPQSYPIPHEHAQTEREKQIIGYYESLRPAPSVEEIKSKLKDAEDAGLILVYDDDFGTVRSQIAQEIAGLGRE